MKKRSTFVILFLIIFLSISVASASTTKTYIYAGSLVASKDNAEDTQYYIQDHLGSNVQVTENGITEQANKYYAFGIIESVGGDNDYKYTGKPFDDETGLYYYGARYYSPELGRFLSSDALRGNIEDPLSLNRYAYVKNNPLKYVDPTGNVRNPADATSVASYTGSVFTKEYVDYLAQDNTYLEQGSQHPPEGSMGTLSQQRVYHDQTALELNGAFLDQNGNVVGNPFRDGILVAAASEWAGGFFFGKIGKSVGKIKRVIFRGDFIKPEEAFEKGFIAGTNKKITARQHIGGLERQDYFNSPWKSATTDENVAARFAGNDGNGYIYYLAETEGRTIDVVKSRNLMGIGDESEILFKGSIKPDEIIGARRVIDLNEADEILGPASLITGDFIPNPYYKPK